MKRIKDERIILETNKLASKLFWLLTALLILLAAGKLLLLEYAANLLLLETACLFSSTLYIIIAKAIKGTLFVKAKEHSLDDSLLKINQAIYTKAFMIDFSILISGEFVLMLIYSEQILIYALYIPVWFIPALIITIHSVKSGLLLWGGQKRKQKGTKALGKTTAIGALFFGIVMGFPEMFHDGQFYPSGLLWVFGMALSWGLLFYFSMRFLINQGEKKADKQVEKEEKEENPIEE